MKEKQGPKIKKPELRSGIGLPKMLLTMDMFSEPLPMFNIRGQSDVRTHCGGCFSILIIFTAIAFALVKLQHLLAKQNPTVNIFTRENAFDETDVWRAKDQKDFMMAFAVTKMYYNEIVKDDPSYVKWFTIQWLFKDGQWTSTRIPMHKCS